jgi:uncharacterized protein YuzE
MEPPKMPARSSSAAWEYDREADVLYLSLGEPRPAVGVDIGDGLVLRYDETRREVTGLTVIGLRRRLMDRLGFAEKAGS